MMRAALFALVVSLAVSSACKKGGGDTPPAGGGSATAGSGSATGSAAPAAAGSAGSAGSGSGSAASGSAAGSDAGSGSATGSAAAIAPNGDATTMAHRAGMCPSTVYGATTTSALKGKSVVVTIESNDRDAVAAIQKRTSELLAEKATASTNTGGGHDMKGSHGGSQGLCPVHVPDGAKATAKKEAKGMIVTITPKDKPDELAADIAARVDRAAAWVKANVPDAAQGNQGGVGGGKGNDGSNHSGKGDGKGHLRHGGGGGGGGGTGGGGGNGTGGGSGKAG